MKKVWMYFLRFRFILFNLTIIGKTVTPNIQFFEHSTAVALLVGFARGSAALNWLFGFEFQIFRIRTSKLLCSFIW